jgi:hypothetical protein
VTKRVDAQGKDIGDLLIKALFGHADRADAANEFVEIIVPGLAQAFVIHDEALDDIFLEPLRRPTAKLGTARRCHAITY